MEIRKQGMQYIIRYFNDEEGVTAIEYGVIALLMIIVAVTAITATGTSLAGIWGALVASL